MKFRHLPSQYSAVVLVQYKLNLSSTEHPFSNGAECIEISCCLGCIIVVDCIRRYNTHGSSPEC